MLQELQGQSSEGSPFIVKNYKLINAREGTSIPLDHPVMAEVTFHMRGWKLYLRSWKGKLWATPTK